MISSSPIYTPFTNFLGKFYLADELGVIFTFDPQSREKLTLSAPLGKITTPIQGFQTNTEIFFLISKADGEILLKDINFENLAQTELNAESWSGIQERFIFQNNLLFTGIRMNRCENPDFFTDIFLLFFQSPGHIYVCTASNQSQ